MGTINSVLTNFFIYFFYNHVSYTFRKYSDFLKTKNFSDFPGYNITMLCQHIYEETEDFICRHCDQPTHKTKWLAWRQEHKKYQKELNVYSREYENPTVWWSI